VTKKRLTFVILAFVTAGIAAALFFSSLSGTDPYEPENAVAKADPLRSRQMVAGEGYKLDREKKKELKQQENRKERIRKKKPESPADRKRKARSGRPETRDDDNGNRNTEPDKEDDNGGQEEEKPKKKTKEDRDADKELPIIRTSLKQGEVLKGAVKRFTVSATTYDGEPIGASDITVIFNGTRLTADDGETKYTGDVKNGVNVIKIYVKDRNNKRNSKVFKLKGNTRSKPKVIGQTTVVVTGNVLGIPTILPKKTVKIYDNDALSDVVIRYFSMNPGVTYIDGDSGRTFYLEYICKEGIVKDLPDSKAEELGIIDIEKVRSMTKLGPGSFSSDTGADGWKYKVTKKGRTREPNQYMNQLDPAGVTRVEIFYNL